MTLSRHVTINNMQEKTKNTLKEIGLQLDRNQFPHVYNSGIVKPSDMAVVSSTLGEEKTHVAHRQRRPETRSWQRATGWQRPTSRPRSSSRATPHICSSLRNTYEAELVKVREAYPDTKIWQREEGLWLLTNSSVLTGLGKKATFLCAIPYSPLLSARSWGYWTTAISSTWIGPRHTNFPDGSICAFEPSDGTWKIGDSIVKLLDLYTLWALRHEHLEQFNRWPGYQAVPNPYERLSELRDDEFCGCDQSDRLYGKCCKKSDLSANQVALALDFWYFTGGHQYRKPPPAITDFIRKQRYLPSIFGLFS